MKISTVIEIYNCFTGILQFSSSHDMILLDNIDFRKCGLHEPETDS